LDGPAGSFLRSWELRRVFPHEREISQSADRAWQGKRPIARSVIPIEMRERLAQPHARRWYLVSSAQTDLRPDKSLLGIEAASLSR